jgi:hypothetical protein
VQGGTLEVYSEITSKDGAFKGYAKPFLRDLNVVDIKKEDLTFRQKLKEGLAELAGNVLQNQKDDSTAARIPFSGTFDKPSVGVLSTVGSLLRHILIQALSPSLDRNVGPSNPREEPPAERPRPSS